MRGGVVLMAMVWATLAWGHGGHDLTDQELQTEIARNRTLAAYVDRNGMPDLAETRFLSDQPPWDDHEVTLYYLDAKKEIAFARAWILGRPTIQIERYERPLSAKRVAALSRRARKYQTAPLEPGDSAAVAPIVVGSGPDQRAEAAAQRAEAAATRVESAATSAEHAAEHTEAVTNQMERAMRRGSRK